MENQRDQRDQRDVGSLLLRADRGCVPAFAEPAAAMLFCNHCVRIFHGFRFGHGPAGGDNTPYRWSGQTGIFRRIDYLQCRNDFVEPDESRARTEYSPSLRHR